MNKIFKYAGIVVDFIGKALDFIKKNISRLKTIGSVLVLFMFIISLGGNSCQRSKMADMIKRFAELDFKNLILRKDLSESDSLNIVTRMENDSLEKEIILWKNKATTLEKSENVMRNEIRSFKDSLLNVPPDTSYAFLQRAYPYPGEYKYPFNEPQVTNMHLDYLKNNSLWLLNRNLMEQVENCNLIVKNQDKISLNKKVVAERFSKQKSSYEEIISNKDEVNEQLIKDKNKAEHKTVFWKVLTGIAAVAAALIAL